MLLKLVFAFFSGLVGLWYKGLNIFFVLRSEIKKRDKKRIKKQKKWVLQLESFTGYSLLNFQEAFILGRLGLLSEKILLSSFFIKQTLVFNLLALCVCFVAALKTAYYDKFRFKLVLLYDKLCGSWYGQYVDYLGSMMEFDYPELMKIQEKREKTPLLKLIYSDIKEGYYFQKNHPWAFKWKLGRMGINFSILFQLCFFAEPVLFLVLRFSLYVLLITNALNIFWTFFCFFLLFGRMFVLLPHRTYNLTKYEFAKRLYKMRFGNICIKPTYRNAQILGLWIKKNYLIYPDDTVTEKNPKVHFYFSGYFFGNALYNEGIETNLCNFTLDEDPRPFTYYEKNKIGFLMVFTVLVILFLFVTATLTGKSVAIGQRQAKYYIINPTWAPKNTSTADQTWEYKEKDLFLKPSEYIEPYRETLEGQKSHKNILSVTLLNENAYMVKISTLQTDHLDNRFMYRSPVSYDTKNIIVNKFNINHHIDLKTRQFFKLGFQDVFSKETLAEKNLIEVPFAESLFNEFFPIAIPLLKAVGGITASPVNGILKDYFLKLLRTQSDYNYSNSDFDQKIISYIYYFFNDINLTEPTYNDYIKESSRFIHYLISNNARHNPFCSSKIKSQLKEHVVMRNAALNKYAILKASKDKDLLWDPRIEYSKNDEEVMQTITFMNDFLRFSEKNKNNFAKCSGDKNFKKAFLDEHLPLYNTKSKHYSLTDKNTIPEINNNDELTIVPSSKFPELDE